MKNNRFTARSLVLILLALSLASVHSLQSQPKPSIAPSSATATNSVELLPWSNPESAKRFDRSTAKVDFFKLANQFENQINKFYCGPATSVIVLNTLRFGKTAQPKPEEPTLYSGPKEFLPKEFNPVFQRYTQQQFFNAKSDAVKTKDEVFGKPKEGLKDSDYGLQIRQLAGILKTYGLSVELRIADEKLSDAKIKAELIKNLETADDYVIVNYSRPAVGQKGGGHISPLGAYDRASDSFLVMDVNPNVAEWVWMKSADLIRAMRTHDTVENRGYLLVKEGS